MSTLAKLLLLLTLMPILEISLLIPIHNAVGNIWTLAIVIFTATLGTILIKWQGGSALRRIKETMGEGKLPGDEILDGVLIIISSITLITPGVVTDTIGLVLLIPTFRAPVRRMVMKRIKAWIDDKTGPSSLGFESDYESHAARSEPPSMTGEAGEPSESWKEAKVEEPAHIGRPDDIL